MRPLVLFFGLRERGGASHIGMSSSGPTLASLSPLLKSVVPGFEQQPPPRCLGSENSPRALYASIS